MDVVVVPCLFDNYAYIIYNEATREAAVVDPSEAWPVKRELGERGLMLTSVLCTHHHHDHIGGVDDLLDDGPDNIRVMGYRGEANRISQLNELLDDGDTVTVCGISGQVFHTPGHTTGGMVYHVGDCVFTGDTLFGAGCGRLFEGTAGQMMRSLQKITACGKDKKLYFGHEYTLTNLRFAAGIDPENEAVKKRFQHIENKRENGEPSAPSTVAEELLTNPFLRCGETSIISGLENRNLLKDSDPETVFAQIRELRNRFS